MTEKNSKQFKRVVIIASVFWVSALAADIIIPLLHNYLNPSTARGHGGGGIMIATPLCVAAVVIALIVCLVKSKKENDQPQNGEKNEHTE